MVRNSNSIDGFFARQRYGRVLRLIREGQSGKSGLLDIGCGEDGGILPHAKEFSNRHGCDRLFPSTMTKEGVVYSPVDLASQRLPYKDGQFDCVTCTAVIEHLDCESAGKVFSEAFRVLKPGSTLVMTTPAPHTKRLQELLAKARVISEAEIAEHKHLFSLPELEGMAKKAGFQQVKASRWQLGMNQLISARKPPGPFGKKGEAPYRRL